MTKNFKILNDYDVSSHYNEEIKNSIEKIENFALTKQNLNNAYQEAGLILERILQEEHEGQLAVSIRYVVDRRAAPTRVANALYSVKRMRNEAVHAPERSDTPFVIKTDIISIIELLKYLFIIIKYFVSVRNPSFQKRINDNEYDFDFAIYHDKLTTMTKKSSALDSTYRISTELKNVFKLITSDIKFIIPPYQRDYTWSIENIETFLDDIKNQIDSEKNEDYHYLGSLALGIANLDDKVLHIIDGQQRITTSLLLIRAIINYFKKNNLHLPEELAAFEPQLALKYQNKTSSYNRLAFVKRILENRVDNQDKNFLTSSVLINFNHIKNKLKQMNADEFQEFYAAFYSNFFVSQVVFKNELSDEIEVFENLNSKGTKLSDWDLIKNYIYKKVNLPILIKQEDALEKLINRLFVLKASQYFGKQKNQKLSKFFMFYCRIEHMLKNKEVLTNKSKVFRIFSKLWPASQKNKFATIEELEAALRKPARLFYLYCLLESRAYLKNSSNLFELKLHLENLAMKDAHYPVVMNVIFENARWKDNEIDRIPEQNIAKLITFVGDIDKYVTRLIVVKNVGQSLANFFDELISTSIATTQSKFQAKITNNQNTHTSLPSLAIFHNEIKTKNDWQAAYAIAYLRTLSWSGAQFDSRKYEIFDKPVLERIFPQAVNSQSRWFKATKMNWNAFEEKLQDNVNKLGNYLIIMNKKSFKNKEKDFASRQEDYRLFADDDLLLGHFGKQQKMNLKPKTSFTFTDIKNRTRDMADMAWSLYKLSFE